LLIIGGAFFLLLLHPNLIAPKQSDIEHNGIVQAALSIESKDEASLLRIVKQAKHHAFRHMERTRHYRSVQEAALQGLHSQSPVVLHFPARVE